MVKTSTVTLTLETRPISQPGKMEKRVLSKVVAIHEEKKTGFRRFEFFDGSSESWLTSVIKKMQITGPLAEKGGG